MSAAIQWKICAEAVYKSNDDAWKHYYQSKQQQRELERLERETAESAKSMISKDVGKALLGGNPATVGSAVGRVNKAKKNLHEIYNTADPMLKQGLGTEAGTVPPSSSFRLTGTKPPSGGGTSTFDYNKWSKNAEISRESSADWLQSSRNELDQTINNVDAMNKQRASEMMSMQQQMNAASMMRNTPSAPPPNPYLAPSSTKEVKPPPTYQSRYPRCSGPPRSCGVP